MIPKILHLYGPFYINSYGVCIALGILIVFWLSQSNPKRSVLLSSEQFISLIMYCIFGGLIGGRILFLLTTWNEIEYPFQVFELWNGGGAILGSIIGGLLSTSWFCYRHAIPTLPLLDFLALYAPLLQSISRIGCFFAGCCYGRPSDSLFAITYTHPEVVAPRFISLHPTQLYSVILLFLIFLIVNYMEKRTTRDGQLMALYLMLSSLERFFIDFLRGDQQFFTNSIIPFTINQAIAIILFGAAGISYCFTLRTKTHEPI